MKESSIFVLVHDHSVVAELGEFVAPDNHWSVLLLVGLTHITGESDLLIFVQDVVDDGTSLLHTSKFGLEEG